MLTGLEVSAISLVRDYVEVHFDGPVLRALSDPYGRWEDVQWHFPEPGAIDVMRLYIGSTVAAVEERPELWLKLTTSRGSDFVIPLDADSRTGPEAAHLVAADAQGRPNTAHGMWVW